MKKAFEEGWGGVIAKTVSVDSSKVNRIDLSDYLRVACMRSIMSLRDFHLDASGCMPLHHSDELYCRS